MHNIFGIMVVVGVVEKGKGVPAYFLEINFDILMTFVTFFMKPI